MTAVAEATGRGHEGAEPLPAVRTVLGRELRRVDGVRTHVPASGGGA